MPKIDGIDRFCGLVSQNHNFGPTKAAAFRLGLGLEECQAEPKAGSSPHVGSAWARLAEPKSRGFAASGPGRNITTSEDACTVQGGKLISGRYLSEILRLVICELIDKSVLFLGQNMYKLEAAYGFDTAFLSLPESDPTDELLMGIGAHLHALLRARRLERGLVVLPRAGEADWEEGSEAECVWDRGGGEQDDVRGSGGWKYPGFADSVHEGLVDIFGEGRNIVTHHTEDGSGGGTADFARARGFLTNTGSWASDFRIAVKIIKPSIVGETIHSNANKVYFKNEHNLSCQRVMKDTASWKYLGFRNLALSNPGTTLQPTHSDTLSNTLHSPPTLRQPPSKSQGHGGDCRTRPSGHGVHGSARPFGGRTDRHRHFKPVHYLTLESTSEHLIAENILGLIIEFGRYDYYFCRLS
ncbi:hypothetical protein K438DRAFT_1764066 [Mycena galopus ATCC 62051]|nr:hypothetical protein K438DRAFT_1764066 [Mycena galopus ATCC 62051]